MAQRRAARPDSPPVTVRLPRSVVPFLGLAVLAVATGAFALHGRWRALEAENAALARENRDLEAREDELANAAARQAARARELEAELDQVRFQVDAVELQLDGVDLIGRELRSAIAGDAPADAEPPGSGGAFGLRDTLGQRLELARARLADDLALLVALRDALAPPAGPAAAPADPAARAVPAAGGGRPANWPARGVVTSDFGWRTFRGRANFHSGIDVALPHGSQVLSTGYGTVVGSGWQPGFGWSLLIQHGDGYNSLYAHLSRTIAAVGDRVAPGTLIGLSGSSGNSTGPHLHYEIWKDGRVLDPRPLMDGIAGSGDPS